MRNLKLGLIDMSKGNLRYIPQRSIDRVPGTRNQPVLYHRLIAFDSLGYQVHKKFYASDFLAREAGRDLVADKDHKAVSFVITDMREVGKA